MTTTSVRPKISEGQLVMYVIYDRPNDHPDHFVVRVWAINMFDGATVTGAHSNMTKHKTLVGARAEGVPDGAVNIGRMSQDDPVIKEVWI